MSGSILDQIANPKQVNLLGAYQGANDVARGMWANRQSQANQLAGQAAQGAIDPATGQYSPDLYRQNLAGAGPGAALAAREGLAANQALSSDQLNQAKDKLRYVNDAAGSLTRLGDKLSPADVLSVFSEGLKSGMLTMPEVQKQMAGLPSDNAGLLAWAKQHQFQAMSTQQQLEQTYGARTPVNTGGDTQFPVVPPASAGGPGPIVPNTPTPGDRNELKSTWDPVQRKFVYTRNQDIAPMVDGAGQPVAGSAVPGLPTSGRPPPPGTTTPAPGAANIAKPSPGTEEEMQGAAAHLLAARDRANNYQSTIQPIEGALSALAGADTGKASETLQTLRAYAQDVAPTMLQKILPSALMDKDARVAFDEANKYVTGMALSSPGGSRSNAGEAAASAANPSVHISNAAARIVARAILAQRRLEQAGTLAFNQSGQPAGNYDGFMNTWNTNQDPRAFIADRMSPAERAATVKDLGGVGSSAYQRYKASYLEAQGAKVTDANR